ncbi:MAG: tape measure protein [Chloroflexota bacterium]
MAEREVYTIDITANLVDTTEAPLRQLRQRVTGYERTLQRDREKFRRQQLQAQRHQVAFERQRAQLHRATAQREQADFRRHSARVQFQRQEVLLQRQQVQLHRQQFSLQQAQERHARVSQSRSLRSRLGAGLRGGLAGIGRGILGAPGAMLRGAGGLLGNVFSLPGLVAGYAANQAVQAGIMWPLQLVSNLQQATISMTRFLGSGQAAADMLDHIRRVALDQPLFGTEQLRGLATQLLSFKFAAPDIKSMLPILADTASALPMGAEGAQHIARALGQIFVKGRVQGDELLQLQEAGINATQYIAEGWGIAKESVMDYVSRGAVPARRAIRHILEGLKRDFGGLGKAQAATLAGLGATLRETFEQKFVLEWGKGLATAVQPRLEQLVKWLDENQDTVRTWGELLGTWGASLGEAALAPMQQLIGDLTTFFTSEAWTNASTFGDKMGVLFGGMKSWLLGTPEERAGGQVGGLVGGVITWIKETLGTFVSTQWTNFSTMVGRKFDDLKTVATTKFTELVSWITGEFTTRVVTAIEELNPFRQPGKTSEAAANWLNQTSDTIAAWLNRQGGEALGELGGPPGGLGGPGSPLQGPAAEAAQQAITQGLGYLGSREFIDLCLKFIDDMFGAAGPRFNTAWEAGKALATTTGTKLGEVPAGMLAFMRADPTNKMAGHVMLSLGGGRFLDPSSQGVRITGPGDPLFKYYSERFYGYGQHGTRTGLTGGVPVTAPASAAGGQTAVDMTGVQITVNGASDPHETAAVIADELAGHLAVRLGATLPNSLVAG